MDKAVPGPSTRLPFQERMGRRRNGIVFAALRGLVVFPGGGRSLDYSRPKEPMGRVGCQRGSSELEEDRPDSTHCPLETS